MKDLTDKNIGGYIVRNLLGRGGTGVVFRAEEAYTNRIVALKIVLSTIVDDQSQHERFIREAKAMQALEGNPNVVTVYKFGYENEIQSFYLAMEYVADGSLRKLMDQRDKDNQTVTLREALDWGQQIAGALGHAHKHGIVHRDVKPENVLIKRDNEKIIPKLTDFGLARMDDGVVLTQMKDGWAGTLAYVSPEQCNRAMGDVSPRSDVYSLGIMLYELAVGKTPFDIRDEYDAIRAHREDQPVSPRTLKPDIPESVERIILRCLEKQPANRYADGNALALELQHALALPNLSNVTVRVAAKTTRIYQRPSDTTVRDNAAVVRPPQMDNVLPIPAGLYPQVYVLDEQGKPVYGPVDVGDNGVTVGKGTHNTIILGNDILVSGDHARLSWNAQQRQVSIADVGSENGTHFSNGRRLQDNTPEVWKPDDSVRIGRHWLRLALPQVSASHAAGSPVNTNTVNMSVKLLAKIEQLTVGQPKTVRVEVSNLNHQITAHIQINVEGVPREWVRAVEEIRLNPYSKDHEDWKTIVDLVVTAPAKPSSVAKDYPVTVVASSPDFPGELARDIATWTVLGYCKPPGIKLRPTSVTTRQSANYDFQIRNDSNDKNILEISAEDETQRLGLLLRNGETKQSLPKTARMAFEAGEVKGFTLTAAGKRRWAGSNERYSFRVQANVVERELLNTRDGELVQQPLFPPWLFKVGAGMVAATLMLFGAAAYLFKPVLEVKISTTYTADGGPDKLIVQQSNVTHGELFYGDSLTPVATFGPLTKGEPIPLKRLPRGIDKVRVHGTYLFQPVDQIVTVEWTPTPTILPTATNEPTPPPQPRLKPTQPKDS